MIWLRRMHANAALRSAVGAVAYYVIDTIRLAVPALIGGWLVYVVLTHIGEMQ